MIRLFKMILTFIGVVLVLSASAAIGVALVSATGIGGPTLIAVAVIVWMAIHAAREVGRAGARQVSRKAPRNEARLAISEQQHERREPRLFREGSPITVMVPRPKIVTTHRRTIEVTDEWTEDRRR